MRNLKLIVTFLLLAMLNISFSLAVDTVQKYNREDYEEPSSSPAGRQRLPKLKRVMYHTRSSANNEHLDQVLHKLHNKKKPPKFSRHVETDDIMDRLLRMRRASMPN
jgi:hypothetical protein